MPRKHLNQVILSKDKFSSVNLPVISAGNWIAVSRGFSSPLPQPEGPPELHKIPQIKIKEIIFFLHFVTSR
jgi:hypothetical protein